MRINDPIRNSSLTPADILDFMADGLSYEQIITRHPELSYKDIFEAADHAANLMRAIGNTSAPGEIQKVVRKGREARKSLRHESAPLPTGAALAKIREQHSRAYEKWTAEEDRRLLAEHRRSQTMSEIAAAHHRQPGANRSRLAKLGIIEG